MANFNLGGAASGAASGAAIGSIFGPIGTGIGAIGGGLFGAFGGKKKKQEQDGPNQGGFRTLEFPAPKYEGRSPYSSPLDTTAFNELGQRYNQQIGERSQGQGMVGFDPARRNILRDEYNQDFNDYSKQVMDRASQQASGQGFRGGIPLETSQLLQHDLGRARQSALAGIDVEDLAARREDINKATYAQPDYLNNLATIQSNAANFDLNRAKFEQPERFVGFQNEEPSFLSQLAPLASSFLASRSGEGETQPVNEGLRDIPNSVGGSNSIDSILKAFLAQKNNNLAPGSAFQRAISTRRAA